MNTTNTPVNSFQDGDHAVIRKGYIAYYRETMGQFLPRDLGDGDEIIIVGEAYWAKAWDNWRIVTRSIDGGQIAKIPIRFLAKIVLPEYEVDEAEPYAYKEEYKRSLAALESKVAQPATPPAPVRTEDQAPFAVGQQVVNILTNTKGEIVRIAEDGWLVVQTATVPETLRWNTDYVRPVNVLGLPLPAPDTTATKPARDWQPVADALTKAGLPTIIVKATAPVASAAEHPLVKACNENHLWVVVELPNVYACMKCGLLRSEFDASAAADSDVPGDAGYSHCVKCNRSTVQIFDGKDWVCEVCSWSWTQPTASAAGGPTKGAKLSDGQMKVLKFLKEWGYKGAYLSNRTGQGAYDRFVSERSTLPLIDLGYVKEAVGGLGKVYITDAGRDRYEAELARR